MRPPICAICEKDHSTNKEFFMVNFALTTEDKLFNKRFEEDGFCGHPAGLEWFCDTHVQVARNFAHLPIKQALPRIRETFDAQK